MSIKIFFSDLAHTSQGISSISFPLGISFVASYAKKYLKDKIEVELFKYPDDLSRSLEKKQPEIVCFSNYSWTIDISHEFAKRIKEKDNRTIVIFGGPNFPIEVEEQKRFLEDYPFIDIYIRGEGEKAFLELFEKLEKLNFNLDEFKKNKIESGNCYYIYNGELINGNLLPKIGDLDEIPSPYLNGMMDKFFDEILIPNFQTTRGCPFSCAYCQEGQEYFNKISRFSAERVREELNYIAKRARVPNLIISDSNFCMYDQDKETCKTISELKENYNWPKYFEVSLGKNKQKVLENISLLKGSVLLSAPVQSTDEEVLSNIKRKNISMNQLIDVTKAGEKYGASSFSEIILALPGDSCEKHYKSIFDMIDAGINIVRSHQLLMLPGAEISTNKYREKFKMRTKFRIQPRCFGNYEIYEEKFPSAETDEVCIENSTLSMEDYLKCRKLDLTIEVFYNNGIFKELMLFLNNKNVSNSEFIKRIDKNIDQSQMKEVYEEFLKENSECLWDEKKELLAYIKSPGMITNFIKNEIRNNEQLKYRALAIFYRMKEMHDYSFKIAREILIEKGGYDAETEAYLKELCRFSLARKEAMLDFSRVEIKSFDYDFCEILDQNFNANPLDYKKNVKIKFFHTPEQKELITKYLKQFGKSLNGIGLILSRSHAEKFYRKIEKVN